MDKLKLSQHLYDRIMATIGTAPVESGGVFALEEEFETVSDYFFDAEAGSGKPYYEATVNTVNRIVGRFQQAGQRFGGFIHSHRSATELSLEDKLTAELTCRCNSLQYVYMGIVCEKELFVYKYIPAEEPGNLPEIKKCVVEITSDAPRRQIPAWIAAIIRRKIRALEQGEA